jgi:hypothetical protein
VLALARAGVSVTRLPWAREFIRRTAAAAVAAFFTALAVTAAALLLVALCAPPGHSSDRCGDPRERLLRRLSTPASDIPEEVSHVCVCVRG